MKSVTCPKCFKPTQAATKTTDGWRYYCVKCAHTVQPTDVIPRSYFEEKRK